MTQAYNEIQPGWDVYSNSGDHIASIADINDGYITISKGLFLPKDYFIPSSAIQNVDSANQRVFLSVGKDDLDRMGWDDLSNVTSGDTATARGYSSDVTTDQAVPSANANTASQEAQRLPRYEEELRAEKTSQQAGEVEIRKDVTEEEQSFDVPVTREDVEIRRVAVNRPADADEGAFQDGETVRVPVRSEQVQVTKEPRVVEEIEVRKTPRQETQRVSDTVRKEQFDVNQQGDVDVNANERELAGAGADRFQSQHDWDRAAEEESTDSDRSDEERTW